MSSKFPPPSTHLHHELSPFLSPSLVPHYEPCGFPQPIQSSRFESTNFCPSPQAGSYFESHGERSMGPISPMSTPPPFQKPLSPSLLRHEVKVNSFIHPSPATYLTEAICLPPKVPTCPQCKGHKYGFTAYFHNSNIFTEPPHELLMLVEQSYLLRNRLKSLLINYVIRTVDRDRLQSINGEVMEWKDRVECLAREVFISSEGFDLSMDGIDGVKRWAAGMVKRLSDHVLGVKKMEIRNGELTELLVDFKKSWEAVWKGFLTDRRDGQRRSKRLSTRSLEQDSVTPELPI